MSVAIRLRRSGFGAFFKPFALSHNQEATQMRIVRAI